LVVQLLSHKLWQNVYLKLATISSKINIFTQIIHLILNEVNYRICPDMTNVYVPYNHVGEYYTKPNSQEIGNIPKFYAGMEGKKKNPEPKCMGVTVFKYLYKMCY
jgi:hypothetical protein